MKDITQDILSLVISDCFPEPVITVIGDLNYDYIFKSPPLQSGKEVIISGYSRSLAGAAGVVSCGLAKLGAKVYLVTDLGGDSDGRSLFDEMKRHEVLCDGMRFLKDMKNPFTLIFTQEGEETPRQVATFPGTLERFSVNTLDLTKYLLKSSAVYSCNYFIMPVLTEEIGDVFAHAHETNILTVYDANAGDRWENKHSLQTLTEAIYPNTDVIFLNDSEAWWLSGERNPRESIRCISPESMMVLIKRGAEGVVVRYKDSVYEIGAFPLKESIKDTVGAGDSFQACFLYYYLKHFPVNFCSVLGSANAASTLLYHGGVSGQKDKKGLISFITKYQIFDMENGRISIEPR